MQKTIIHECRECPLFSNARMEEECSMVERRVEEYPTPEWCPLQKGPLLLTLASNDDTPKSFRVTSYGDNKGFSLIRAVRDSFPYHVRLTDAKALVESRVFVRPPKGLREYLHELGVVTEDLPF